MWKNVLTYIIRCAVAKTISGSDSNVVSEEERMGKYGDSFILLTLWGTVVESFYERLEQTKQQMEYLKAGYLLKAKTKTYKQW